MNRIHPIRILYFLTFGMMGAWLPFLPLYLKQTQWTPVQIGGLLSLSSVSILVTPVLVTMLADMHVQPKRLILIINFLAGSTFLILWQVDTFWPIMWLFLFYSLVAAPVMALQDGLYFSFSKMHPKNAPPFHRVRVFGTMGFIFPSLIMFVLLEYQCSLKVMMLLAASLCFANMINALFLPKVQRETIKRKRLPTRDALNVILQKHVLLFCAALWLMNMVSAAFYGFHPVFLRETVGLADQWIGLMVNLGVAIEIIFMLSFGWLLGRLGLKKLMVIGIISTAIRMIILAFCSSLPMVLLSQGLHGMMVMVVHVVPPVFLNANAKQSFRSSIQGLFAMVVMGTGRIFGNLIAGYLAAISLTVLYSYAAVLCLIAAVIVLIGLKHWNMHEIRDAKPDDELRVETNALLGPPE
ncbi:MAG: MFS transporter [Phycisphaeraceae bacterium]|nr:MFS transporter [Phycisphaeraceae bacterium]